MSRSCIRLGWWPACTELGASGERLAWWGLAEAALVKLLLSLLGPAEARELGGSFSAAPWAAGTDRAQPGCLYACLCPYPLLALHAAVV